MFGLSFPAVPSPETESSDSSRRVDPTIGKTGKFLHSEGLASKPDGGGGADFSRRLEAALEAVRGQIDPAMAGKVLPGVALATQPLGEATALITPDDGEKTSEEALYALAMAQGLEPGVVAAVLWPRDGVPAASAFVGASGTEPGTAGTAAQGALVNGVGAVPTDLGLAALGAQGSAGVLQLASVPMVDAGRTLAPTSPGLPSFANPMSVAGSASVPGSQQIDVTGMEGDLPSLSMVSELRSSAFAEGALTPQFGRSTLPGDPSLTPNDAQRVPSAPLGSLNFGTLKITGELATAQPGAQWDRPTAGDRAQGARTMPSVGLTDLSVDGVTRASSGGTAAPMMPAALWALRYQRPDWAASSQQGVHDSGATPAPNPSDGSGGGAQTLEEPFSEVSVGHHGAKSEPIDLSMEPEVTGAQGRGEAHREAMQQKLSEALAQRMVAQVNRGQWSLQIELKPADLGSITIDLTVRNGQLDAVFDATNAPARALISDGLDRLRHELERSGMNVASLGLQNASGGSSGGKPTPQRPEHSPDGLAERGADHEDPVEGVSRAGRRGDNLGLDLLV